MSSTTPYKCGGSYFPADGECWYELGGAKTSKQMDLLLLPTGTSAKSANFPFYISVIYGYIYMGWWKSDESDIVYCLVGYRAGQISIDTRTFSCQNVVWNFHYNSVEISLCHMSARSHTQGPLHFSADYMASWSLIGWEKSRKAHFFPFSCCHLQVRL